MGEILNQEMLEIATIAVKRYAETHPRPPHVNQKQAAEMLHISQQTMGKLVRAGKFKLNSMGLIPITQIDDVIFNTTTK